MNRIPDYNVTNPDGMLIWFAEMAKRNLFFHPDDDPAEIIKMPEGTRIFSDEEMTRTRKILGEFFERHGDDVYEAAYPIMMSAAGIRLDA